jgi:hypothetical protein
MQADNDGIKQMGFLSPEIEQYRAHYLKTFSVAFTRLEMASSQATEALFELQMQELSYEQGCAVLFWLKCVAHCQAAFILLEHGMAPQAQVMVRSAVEHLFFACAILKDGSVLQRLAVADDAQRRTQAHGMLRLATLTPSQREELESMIQEPASAGKGISAFDAAHIAGQEDLYQTIYRGLSLVAAHGTLSSADSALQVDFGDVQTAQAVFGPSPEGVEWTLGLAATLLARGLQQFLPLGRPAGG